MIFGDIVSVCLSLVVGLYITWMEYRVSKLERKLNEYDTLTHLLIYDFIKKNKKNIKGIKLDKEIVDELFK